MNWSPQRQIFPEWFSELPGLAEDAEPTSEQEVQTLEAHLRLVGVDQFVADSDQVDPTRGVLTLMSLHASKGLEFESGGGRL